MTEPRAQLSAEELRTAIDECERMVKAHAATLKNASGRLQRAEEQLRESKKAALHKRAFLLPNTWRVAAALAAASFFAYAALLPDSSEPNPAIGTVVRSTNRALLGAPCSFSIERGPETCRTLLACGPWEYDATHPCIVEAVEYSSGEGGTTREHYLVVSGPRVPGDETADERESAPVFSYDERRHQVSISQRATERSEGWSIRVLIHRFRRQF